MEQDVDRIVEVDANEAQKLNRLIELLIENGILHGMMKSYCMRKFVIFQMKSKTKESGVQNNVAI